MKPTSHVPRELVELFRDHFSFPTKPLFGSVATIHNQQPRVRTMRIYEFSGDGCPVLLTHTGSNKWSEFVKHPLVSISFVSDSKLLQIIVSGRLVLETADSARADAARYWNMVRADVKKIYDPAHKIEQTYVEPMDLSVPKSPPSTFGIACVIPHFWEALQLQDEYVNSHRYQFILKDNDWQKQRIHVG